MDIKLKNKSTFLRYELELDKGKVIKFKPQLHKGLKKC